MRMQFTKENQVYTVETVASFAKYLASRFATTEKLQTTQFIADFALTSYDEDNESFTFPKVLSDLRETGWYGVKELGNVGFDSSNRQLAFDYYGGGKMHVFDYDESYMDKDDAEQAIKEILMDIFDITYDRPLLLIQWTEDKCSVKEDKQEKLVTEFCPECNTENTLVWDVEEDGYVAYCPHCGARMMLCDECQHADDAPETCDCSNCGHCYRDR